MVKAWWDSVVTAAVTSGSTQDFTVSSTTETPKAAIISVVSSNVQDSLIAHKVFSMGATDGVSQGVISGRSRDNLATSDCSMVGSKTALISVLTIAGGLDGFATFNSFIAGGIRVNWLNNLAVGYLVHVTLIFGDNVQADLEFGTPDGVEQPDKQITFNDGSEDFEPDHVYTLCGPLFNNAIRNGIRMHPGHVLNKASIEARTFISIEADNAATSAVIATWYDDPIIGTKSQFEKPVPIARPATELTEFNSTGVKIATTGVLSDLNGPGPECLMLGLKYGDDNDVEFLSDESPGSDGTVTYSTGFQPWAAMGFASGSNDSTTPGWQRISVHGGQAGPHGIHAFFNRNVQFCPLVISADNQTTSNTATIASSHALEMYSHTQNAQYEADFVDFNELEVELDWDITSTTGRDWCFVLLETDTVNADSDGSVPKAETAATATTEFNADSDGEVAPAETAATATTIFNADAATSVPKAETSATAQSNVIAVTANAATSVAKAETAATATTIFNADAATEVAPAETAAIATTTINADAATEVAPAETAATATTIFNADAATFVPKAETAATAQANAIAVNATSAGTVAKAVSAAAATTIFNAIAATSVAAATTAATATVVELQNINADSAGVVPKATTAAFARTQLKVTPLPLPAVITNFFRHNWASAVEMSSAFLTDVTPADTTRAEDRRGLADRPRRTITARFTGIAKGEGNLLQLNLMRYGDTDSMPFPLVQDFAKVDASSSGNDIFCDPADRRFFSGARVVIHDWVTVDGRTRPGDPEFAIIDTVQSDRLTTVDPLVGTFGVGSRVYPCLDIQPNLDGSMTFYSDETGDFVFTGVEKAGGSQLPPVASGLPAGFPTHDGYPILDLKVDWSTNVGVSSRRAGKAFAQGRGDVTILKGDRPQLTHSLPFTFLQRSEFWKLLRFFESRAGRLNPFWLISPQSAFEVQQFPLPDGSKVEIKAQGNIEDLQDYLPYIGFVLKDGTHTIRAVTSVAVVDSDTWEIVFDTPIVPLIALDQIRRCTHAWFCRNDSDALLERWSDDEGNGLVFTAFDLLNEKSVVTADIDLPADNPAAAVADVADLYYWGEVNRNMWQYQWAAGGTTPNRQELLQIDSVQYNGAGEPSVWDDRRETGYFPLAPVRPYLRREGDGVSPNFSMPIIARFLDDDINDSLPFLVQRSGASGQFVLVDAATDTITEPFWDNTNGLTVFWAGRLARSPGGAKHRFLHRSDDDTEEVYTWDEDGVRMFESVGVPDSNLNTTGSAATGGERTVMVHRWEPSTRSEVWRDGTIIQEVTPGSNAADSLPTDAKTNFVLEMVGISTITDDDMIDGSDEAENSITNALIIFKRSLSNAELSAVAGYLAARHGGTW